MSSGKDVLYLLRINYYLTLTYCQSEKFYFSVFFLRMINSGQYKFLCFFMLMTFLSEWLRAISVVRNIFLCFGKINKMLFYGKRIVLKNLHHITEVVTVGGS